MRLPFELIPCGCSFSHCSRWQLVPLLLFCASRQQIKASRAALDNVRCAWQAGSQGIPTDEAQIATDLYDGLQQFFSQHKDLQSRPFFITGESYSGKYVPAIGALSFD